MGEPPIAVGTRFKMRIWGRERAIKVDVKARETENAQNVPAPCCIVVQGLVKEWSIPQG